jgi:threonine dehydratase
MLSPRQVPERFHEHIAPDFSGYEAAALRISGHCLQTPLLESPALNQMLGGRLLLKCENLQYTGSFKLRGAVNRLAAMTDDERARGVVARSSGNHGLALGTLAVTDDEVKSALRTAFSEFGLAIEPGGAVALAAVLTGRFPITGKTVAVTLSGRNVDLDIAGPILDA